MTYYRRLRTVYRVLLCPYGYLPVLAVVPACRLPVVLVEVFQRKVADVCALSLDTVAMF